MKIFFFAFLLNFMLTVPFVQAAFDKDLSLASEDVYFSENIILNKQARIYTTVRNNSTLDLSGVVKIYDERLETFVDVDQPISVVAGSTDDVFVDWTATDYGEHSISIRVVPWEEEGDDPNNNKIIKRVFVDRDSDNDGIGDRLDPDDDNDGVPDTQDDFPLDPAESKDSDQDGVGNNVDDDDDNDGVVDLDDRFPLDPHETKDTDGDTVGDQTDPFPLDPSEWKDSDEDGLGDNSDPDSNNKGPIPEIETSSRTARVGEIITFNALKSRDPDGSVTAYDWEFGDGERTTGVIVDHSFEKQGTYVVTLKVTDDHNEYRVQRVEIVVRSGFYSLVLVMVVILLILLLIFKRYFFQKKSLHKKKK